MVAESAGQKPGSYLSAAVLTVPPQITHVNGVTLGGNHLLLPFGVTLFGYQHTYQNT